jgi:hypothetical protein
LVNPTGLDTSRLAVDIVVDMAPDGHVTAAQVAPRTQAAMAADPVRRTFAQAAVRAALNPRCQPLPYPRHKYEQLKRFVIRFDPRDMK